MQNNKQTCTSHKFIFGKNRIDVNLESNCLNFNQQHFELKYHTVEIIDRYSRIFNAAKTFSFN